MNFIKMFSKNEDKILEEGMKKKEEGMNIFIESKTLAYQIKWDVKLHWSLVLNK